MVAIGYGVATRLVEVRGPERDAKLAAACTDAERLRGARLIDEAAAAYGAIANVEPDKSCVIGKRKSPAERTQTAAMWRKELLADLRISSERIERARLYRRAYVLKRGRGVQRGRRHARQRAITAYL